MSEKNGILLQLGKAHTVIVKQHPFFGGTCVRWVPFLCKKVIRGSNMVSKYKSKSVFCPRCDRKVATWDGRSTIDVIVNCRKCNRQVIYRVDSGETELKKIPARGSSSGLTIL